MTIASTDHKLPTPHEVEDELEQDMSLEEDKFEEEDRFLKKLHDIYPRVYIFQKDLYHPQDPIFSGHHTFFFDLYDKKGGPVVEAMDLVGAKHYSLSELEHITHSFGESNLIFELRGWKLFAAEINQKSVLVKILNIDHGPGPRQLSDELRHLRSSKVTNHPNVVKIIGYHCERRLAVIYEGTRPKHFLSDIIRSDEFGWDDRLKVALDIASVVEAFHCQGFVHGGIDADNFMIYEDYSVMSYHFNVDYYNNFIRTAYKCGYFLHEDGHFQTSDTYGDIDESKMMTMREDVYAYGCLLLALISKKESLYDLCCWWSSADKSTGDLVHESFLQATKEVRSQLTNLVSRCLVMQKDDAHLNPSMRNVVEILSEFQGSNLFPASLYLREQHQGRQGYESWSHPM